MDITNPLRLWQAEGDAQGGLARLAQARQDRPGKGELDLTNILLKNLTGFRETLNKVGFTLQNHHCNRDRG
jgi:hypothetical protein